MSETKQKAWTCPRCKTTCIDVKICDTCGSGPDWKPLAPQINESENDRLKREARKQARIDQEKKDIERRKQLAAERERHEAQTLVGLKSKGADWDSGHAAKTKSDKLLDALLERLLEKQGEKDAAGTAES